MWVIIDLDIAFEGDDQRIVSDYRLSQESIEAARAYYRHYGKYIDAKRLLNDAFFSA